MTAERTISGAGTTEDVWEPHLRGLPPLDLPAVPGRVVALAPHPDDEVLGCGGLLAVLHAAGARTAVVAVTDGEASDPGADPERLRRVRTLETGLALAELGLPPRVLALHRPDGGADALEAPVADLDLGPVDLLLAPYAHDGHPDHEAVARGAVALAARTGARLLEVPVWAWHWAQPDDLPWDRARQVVLPERVRAAKARAVARFHSQLVGDDPVLPPHVLARFARPAEVVLA